MGTEKYDIHSAHAGDFLTFKHDSGLKSYMIFHAVNQSHKDNYHFFVMVDNNGRVHLPGECLCIEGDFRPCTTEEKEFLLRRLSQESLVWEDTQLRLRRMNMFERIYYIFKMIFGRNSH